ncbi:MAG: hypothetical protein M3Q27_14385 [Actinomycetota bacterium]|nr:hypothetical protein [Actinomycetota bacterium]
MAPDATHEPTHSQKTHVAAAEKSAIAAAAAEIVNDGDAVVLGPGATTQVLARHLAARTSTSSSPTTGRPSTRSTRCASSVGCIVAGTVVGRATEARGGLYGRTGRE